MLKKLQRLKSQERVIIGQVNNNLLRNKFYSLKKIARDKIDVLMIFKTKLILLFPRQNYTELIELAN